MTQGPETAVLVSAGLDSVVLLAVEARAARVHPVYVGAGLAWEGHEIAALRRVLAVAPLAGCVEPLTLLSSPAVDLYPSAHWALRGAAPAFDTADEDAYLPGRNILLLSKAAILCASRGIPRLALGPLSSNPFPDATPEFFATMARALSMGLAHEIALVTPFAGMRKADVVRLGIELGVPLEATLSCMSPQDGAHCGRCSKCRERRDAFAEAGVADPTPYVRSPPR